MLLSKDAAVFFKNSTLLGGLLFDEKPLIFAALLVPDGEAPHIKLLSKTAVLI